jgi:hypothetical protein
LEDNIGKDGLSSQSAYKNNIEDFDASRMIVTREEVEAKQLLMVNPF